MGFYIRMYITVARVKCNPISGVDQLTANLRNGSISGARKIARANALKLNHLYIIIARLIIKIDIKAKAILVFFKHASRGKLR